MPWRQDMPWRSIKRCHASRGTCQRFPLCHVTHNVIDQWCGSVHCVLRLLSLNISSSNWQQLEQLAQPDHLRLQPSPLLSVGRAYSKRGSFLPPFKDTGSSPNLLGVWYLRDDPRHENHDLNHRHNTVTCPRTYDRRLPCIMEWSQDNKGQIGHL